MKAWFAPLAVAALLGLMPACGSADTTATTDTTHLDETSGGGGIRAISPADGASMLDDAPGEGGILAWQDTGFPTEG